MRQKWEVIKAWVAPWNSWTRGIFKDVREMSCRRASARSFYRLIVSTPVTPWIPCSISVHPCPAVLGYREACLFFVICVLCVFNCWLSAWGYSLLWIIHKTCLMFLFLFFLNPGPASCYNQYTLQPCLLLLC